jgi:hypothetical protein
MSSAIAQVPWPTLLAGGLVLGLLGLVGFSLRAIIRGDLVTKDQAEFWRKLFEQEQREHEQTREAMLALITQDRAGIEAARLAADVMQGIKQAAEPPL